MKFPIVPLHMHWVDDLSDAHIRRCSNIHNGVPFAKPPMRLFATEKNIGVFLEPWKAKHFVKMHNYSQYDFTIHYDDEEAASRI
jgi:hypothetical protein